jgi:hypothetical protein
MQIPDNPAASLPSNSAPSGAAGRNDGSSFQDLLSQLNAFTGSSPGQGMFNEILAQLGISPQQLAQMTPQEREKVEEKVRELMKKEMQVQIQQQTQAPQLAQAQQTGTQADTSSKKRGTIDFAI